MKHFIDRLFDFLGTENGLIATFMVFLTSLLLGALLFIHK